ncbi:MAG: ABC transporter permease [Acidimicrobiales bacterium]
MTSTAVYGRMLAARVRSDWQYRTSFIIFTISQAFAPLLDFLAIAVLFNRVPQLGSWSLAEVAFLFGLSGVSFGLADTLIGSVEYVSRRIKDGTFDRLLIRPMGALVQLSAEEFAFRRLGKMAQAGTVMALAAANLDITWSPGLAAFTAVTIAAGVVIYGSIWVVTASVAFWSVETQQMANAFTYGGNFVSQYPLTIYAGWVRRLILFVVPIGFVGYMPALVILGRNAEVDRFGLPAILPYLSPVIAGIAFVLARAVWRLGLRHHRSTGS